MSDRERYSAALKRLCEKRGIPYPAGSLAAYIVASKAQGHE